MDRERCKYGTPVCGMNQYGKDYVCVYCQRDFYKQALEHIKQHMDMVSETARELSVTWRIASDVLNKGKEWK